uniref:Retinol dehydrogenase 12 n=1 Tax=Schistocephalus solidus TaxID=70667 RepID=A0A0X3Q2Y3_SCHSO
MWKFAVSVAGVGVGLFALNRCYFSGTICTLPGRLDGKLAVVTGANSGIGRETTAELARRGACVIMACRNLKRAEEAKADILARYGEGSRRALTLNVASSSIKRYLMPVKPEQLIIEELDLASLQSVREFAARICKPDTRIDLLINNAGIMACPYALTKDGFESQVGTNHLGHFLLTELLMPAIKRASPNPRIINVSSLAHERVQKCPEPWLIPASEYKPWTAYRYSKLANAIHARQLAKRLRKDGVVTASVHPGVVITDLFKGPLILRALMHTVLRPFMKSAWEGAQTTMHVVLANDLHSGAYYADCAPKKPNQMVLDDKLGDLLWSFSEKAVGLA